MDNYLLYVAIASATIASPGPGVVLSISNSLRYGFLGSLAGILGVAFGMLGIALLSATSVAVILSTSAFAFTLLKYVGAAYLIYLGIKMWRSSSKFNSDLKTKEKSNFSRFLKGLTITILNPKPIFFFIALFPQFVTVGNQNIYQFLLLVITFSILVIIIHCLYSASANMARKKLSTNKGSKLVSRVSGSFYIFFGLGLAASNK
jgi:threonine/homoserine/homoserine lactone efflux protein